MIICEIDGNGRWTGESREADEREGCPRGWRLIEPPTVGEGEFAEWTPEGWRITSDPVPEPALTPPPVPEAVDMRQASLKLDSEPNGEGTRLDAVDAYVATQSRTVRIEWERAKELRRDHPMVGIMGFFFGMDSDDLDQWFREAAAIGPTLAL